MRALVIKELPDISIYTVLSGSISGELFLSEDLKIGARLQDVILEGAQWQVVKAASEGKSLEHWRADLRKWRKKSSGTFYSDSFYRIAPESPNPQYVPFTADDWEMFVGKPVRDAERKLSGLIVAWDEADVFIGDDWYDYEQAFKELTFLDGRLFGKLQ